MTHMLHLNADFEKLWVFHLPFIIGTKPPSILAVK